MDEPLGHHRRSVRGHGGQGQFPYKCSIPAQKNGTDGVVL